MRAPRPFPPYPKKLDKLGRLKLKVNGRQHYLPKPLGSPESLQEYARLQLEHAAGQLAAFTPKAPEKPGLTISAMIAAFLAADPRGAEDREAISIARACTPLERLFGQTPNDSTPIWELVIRDMQARDKLGRQRYGTPLQANNGRDALKDAYEEALDLAVYLRQAIAERDRR